MADGTPFSFSSLAFSSCRKKMVYMEFICMDKLWVGELEARELDEDVEDVEDDRVGRI